MPIGRVCSGCGSRGKGFSLHYLRRFRKSDERLDERSDLFGVSSIVELAHLVLDLERCLLPLLVLLLAQSADHDAPQREGESGGRERWKNYWRVKKGNDAVRRISIIAL